MRRLDHTGTYLVTVTDSGSVWEATVVPLAGDEVVSETSRTSGWDAAQAALASAMPEPDPQ